MFRYTEGVGHFHVSKAIYLKHLQYLEQLGFDIKRGWGTGVIRKIRLITCAFRNLGLPNFENYQIKRGFYLFPNVKNLYNILHYEDKQIWYN